VVVGLLVRLFRLDTIPAEMWGDVTSHYFLADKILSGNYFFDYEFGGDGPLFSYLAAAVALVTGLSFASLKLTGALIGTLLVLANYFYAETLFRSRRIGYVAAFFTAVSFWPLVMSRQAKPYILVPVLVAVALTFALRQKPALAGIAVGLGVYAQAAFWGTPFLFLLMPAALPVATVVALPVLISFVKNPSLLTGSGSYLGSKLHVVSSPVDRLLRVFDNLGKNLMSFNFTGDSTFRQNIVGHPHLDLLSGILFLVGVGVLLVRAVKTRDRRLTYWFLLPFLVLQIPLLADQFPSDSPNIGRLSCLLPVTMAAVAYGLTWLTGHVCRLLDGRVPSSRLAAGGFAGIILAAVTVINLVNYFDIYPRGLPNRNTPFDLIIAQNIDARPYGTTSILLGCCWGDAGQPEPDAVWFRTSKQHAPVLASTVADANRTITGLAAGSPVTVYSDPSLPTPSGLPLVKVRSRVLVRNGWQVVRVTSGRAE
jgi:hypothetical protein